ncbi:MAG TPA: hypothetical protein VIV60_09255 [Polyangiaceae bacterium]
MYQLPMVCGVAVSLMLGGCMGSQSGHLYNLKTGQTSTINIEEAAMTSNGSVKGSLPDGASCEGQFSKVSIENAQKVSTVTPMLTENSWASVAVLTCGPNRVLRCTIASREWSNFSYGECQDQQGVQYSLVF